MITAAEAGITQNQWDALQGQLGLSPQIRVELTQREPVFSVHSEISVNEGFDIYTCPLGTFYVANDYKIYKLVDGDFEVVKSGLTCDGYGTITSPSQKSYNNRKSFYYSEADQKLYLYAVQATHVYLQRYETSDGTTWSDATNILTWSTLSITGSTVSRIVAVAKDILYIVINITETRPASGSYSRTAAIFYRINATVPTATRIGYDNNSTQNISLRGIRLTHPDLGEIDVFTATKISKKRLIKPVKSDTIPASDTYENVWSVSVFAIEASSTRVLIEPAVLFEGSYRFSKNKDSSEFYHNYDQPSAGNILYHDGIFYVCWGRWNAAKTSDYTIWEKGYIYLSRSKDLLNWEKQIVVETEHGYYSPMMTITDDLVYVVTPTAILKSEKPLYFSQSPANAFKSDITDYIEGISFSSSEITTASIQLKNPDNELVENSILSNITPMQMEIYIGGYTDSEGEVEYKIFSGVVDVIAREERLSQDLSGPLDKILTISARDNLSLMSDFVKASTIVEIDGYRAYPDDFYSSDNLDYGGLGHTAVHIGEYKANGYLEGNAEYSTFAALAQPLLTEAPNHFGAFKSEMINFRDGVFEVHSLGFTTPDPADSGNIDPEISKVLGMQYLLRAQNIPPKTSQSIVGTKFNLINNNLEGVGSGTFLESASVQYVRVLVRDQNIWVYQSTDGITWQLRELVYADYNGFGGDAIGWEGFVGYR